MERYWALQHLRQGAQVVDPVAMVGMIMGDDQPVDPADITVEQLLAKVRAAIDQKGFAGAVEDDRRPCTAIARLVGVAFAPLIADFRHPGRRAAPEDADFHTATFCACGNKRKKLAVVAAASASGSSPRSSATKAAVSATKAGSQVWPRWGTGARNGESV